MSDGRKTQQVWVPITVDIHGKPIVNSAGEPFNPPVQMLVFDVTQEARP